MAENETPPQDDPYVTAVEADKKAYADEIEREVKEQREQNERARAAVAAARKQREPEWEELKRRQAEVDAVPLPKFQKPPTAPNTQEMLKPTSLQKTVGMASVFALLSVGLAKGSGVIALKALGGFLDGAHQGNLEQAGAALKDFNTKMEEVRETNNNALMEYNAIIGNKKYSLEVQDRMFRQKALEFEDELSIQQLEQGGMNAVHVRLRDLAKMNYEFDKELNRHRQIEGQIANQRARAGGAAGMDSVLGIPMSMIPTVPPGQKNEAFLEMLQPAQQQMVRMMDDGSLPVSGFGGFAVKDRNELLKAAAIYNPSFNARKYGVLTKLATEATPGGPTGKNVVAINTMAHHIDDFAEAFDKLDNSQVARWNSASNKLAAEFGDPRLKAVQISATAVADEFAKILKGGTAAPTEDQMKLWESIFSTSMSKSQARETIWQSLKTAGGRLAAMEDAYKMQGGNLNALSPDTKRIILKHKPKNIPAPAWLAGGETKPGGKVTLEQAKEMVKKYGGVRQAMEAAKQQGLVFE